MTFNITYMYDVKIIKDMIKIGNGIGVESTKMGKIIAKFIQKNRYEVEGKIVNVNYVPKL